MKRYAYALATALIATAAMGNAGAKTLSANATASLTGIKIELIDLNLTDNITPWLRINYDSLYGDTWTTVPYGYKIGNSEGLVSLVREDGSASASLSADALISSAFVDTAKPRQDFHGSADREIYFTLSPYTALRFSAIGTLSGAADVLPATSFDAYMSLTAGLRNPEYGWSDSISDKRIAEEDGLGTWNLSVERQTGALAQNGSLLAIAGAHASVYVDRPAPVPEPSTYAMLLAGAGIIGAAARRKARQQRG